MFKHPMFTTWRRVWSATAEELAHQLHVVDELALRRAGGPFAAPEVTNDLLRRVHDPKCRALLRAELDDNEDRDALRELWPLVQAAIWPRWLMLEAALDEASMSGSLHLAALALRTQIEELDVLTPLGRLEMQLGDGNVEDRLFWECIDALRVKVLPRLRGLDQDELVAASNAAPVTPRSASLQEAFDALGDYVHPNYGNHILAIHPESSDAARVMLAAFRAVYETFFNLPWANERGRGVPQSAILAESAEHPFAALAAAIPSIFFADANTDGVTVDELIATCRKQVDADAGVDASVLHAKIEPRPGGASAVLLALDPPLTAMPSLLRFHGDRWCHDALLDASEKLATEATRLSTARAHENVDDEAWLAVLRSALGFSASLTEFKLRMLGRDAARLIADGNVLGAALVVRAILEHHAVAIELGDKLHGNWERLAKAEVAKDEKVATYLQQAEKQLARTLASSPATSEVTTRWRDLWRESVRVYHVMDPVKALDAKEPGFLRTYGLLSHLIHGTAGTGGDFLGSGGDAARRYTLVQLVVFLHRVLKTDAAMDRIVAAAQISQRIAGWEMLRGVSLARRVDAGRVPAGRKLRAGKDVFGTGAREDPFRFRDGLLYHENYQRYLSEQGITAESRQFTEFESGIGEEVFTSDGRTLYFLNDKF